MKMDDLLRTLAEDAGKPQSGFPTQLALGAAIGALASAVLLILSAGVRPDFRSALGSTDVEIKFAFAVLLSVTAFPAVLGAAHPNSPSWRTALPLLAAPGLLAVGVARELASTPAAEWSGASLGLHPELCLCAVPLLAIAPLAATVYVMRRAAPASPARAGGFVGLLSGGLGAGVYMLRCTDDAPLFVAIWYVAAIALTCVIGTLAGRVALRW